MRCIVVDDEPFALDLIMGYVNRTPYLNLLASFSNPYKALAFLQNNKVDLIFLGINMPELSGLQIVKSLSDSPPVIFTTAYPEFGAESYEYNAVDYLLKPISYERFLKAVSKCKSDAEQKELNDSDRTIFLKSGTQIYQIQISTVQFVEAAGNYMTFHTKEKKIMTLMNIKDVLEILSSDDFVRIHKSYVVSLKHIQIIEKHRVIINDLPVPIGVTYRENFLKRFESKK